ncbi:hypothetical protein ACS2UQ_26880, partial [Bacillus cereus group sp. BC305]
MNWFTFGDFIFLATWNPSARSLNLLSFPPDHRPAGRRRFGTANSLVLAAVHHVGHLKMGTEVTAILSRP